MPPEDIKTGEADPLKNVKSEFDRKIGNVDQKLDQTNKTLAGLVTQLQAIAKTATPTKAPSEGNSIQKEIENSWYDNPSKAVHLIKEETKNELRKEIVDANVIQQKTTNTLNTLIRDFPELADQENEFTKRAVQLYSELPEDEKTSPAAYKAAVREAALEMGIKPRSKRSDEELDDFSLRGGGNFSGRSENNARKRNTLNPSVADFARLVGINPEDPKTKERLMSNHGRKRWDKWE